MGSPPLWGLPHCCTPCILWGGTRTNPQGLLASGIQPFLQAVSSGNKIGKPRHSTRLGHARERVIPSKVAFSPQTTPKPHLPFLGLQHQPLCKGKKNREMGSVPELAARRGLGHPKGTLWGHRGGPHQCWSWWHGACGGVLEGPQPCSARPRLPSLRRLPRRCPQSRRLRPGPPRRGAARRGPLGRGGHLGGTPSDGVTPARICPRKQRGMRGMAESIATQKPLP